jgi:hypothetical protein
VKLGGIGTVRQIFTSRPSASPYALFYIYSDDKIHFSDNALNTHMTAAVYRDPSAWYHIQLAIDTTDATAANRVRLWINGTLQTWGSTTAPTQNADGQINTAAAHSIGSPQPYANNEYFSGYLADVYFIDGQALDPTSFGEFDTNGIWQPKAFAGSYGTQGWHLDFADNSSNTATTLGKDTSGNSNNWTPNNLSVTAGAGNDSLVDVPTSYGTDTGVGGEVRGNYATLNPLSAIAYGPGTFSDGNLQLVTSTIAGGYSPTRGTIAVSSGKWYWECVCTNSTPVIFGIGDVSEALPAVPGESAKSYGYQSDGTKRNNSVAPSYGATYGANDVIGVAMDLDAGTLVFYKNNTSQGTAFSGLSGTFTPFISDINSASSATIVCNFGQRAFAYTAPSGFKALNTANLPAPVVTKPSTVMDVKLYTGNGSTQTISGLGFSPDFVWIKSRSAATGHKLIDSVRGATFAIAPGGSLSTDTNGLTAFTSNGFLLGTDTNYNNTSATYVGWCWDTGGTTTTETSPGTVSVDRRVNVSAGFSVTKFTSPASGNFSIAHGLGIAPSFAIVNAVTTYHASVCTTTSNYINLDSTSGLLTFATIWGAALPTSSVVSMTVGGAVSANAACVAYCFAPVSGYSNFGSYTGNSQTGTSGPFIYCGFRPRFVLIKKSDSNDNWAIFDTARDSYNRAVSLLRPNTSGSEDTGDIYNRIDILSNGFAIRVDNAAYGLNTTSTFVWAAFAESPFQYSRAR